MFHCSVLYCSISWFSFIQHVCSVHVELAYSIAVRLAYNKQEKQTNKLFQEVLTYNRKIPNTPYMQRSLCTETKQKHQKMSTSSSRRDDEMAPPALLPTTTFTPDRKRKASNGDINPKKKNGETDAKKKFRMVHFTMLKSLYNASADDQHEEVHTTTDVSNSRDRLEACFQSISNFLSNRNNLQSICAQARFLGGVEEEALQEQKRHRSGSSVGTDAAGNACNKHGDKAVSSRIDDADRQPPDNSFSLRTFGSPLRNASDGSEYSMHMTSRRYRSTKASTWNFTANVIKMQRKLANDSKQKVVRPYKALLDSVSRELDALKFIDCKAGIIDEEKEAEVQAKIELWQCLYDTLNGTFVFDEEN